MVLDSLQPHGHTRLPSSSPYYLDPDKDSMVAQTVKNLRAVQETWVQSLGQEDPLRRKWAPTPVSLPGKSHGQRSLVGYSPWDREELGTAEPLHFHFHMRLSLYIWVAQV